MDRKRFEEWLQSIYLTEDEEISCTECFDLISSYVELELAGASPADQMPQVLVHLYHCQTCFEEYETLLDLRRWEDEGGALLSDEL